MSINRAIVYVAVNQTNAGFPLLMEFTKFAKKPFEPDYAVPDSPASNPVLGFATSPPRFLKNIFQAEPNAFGLAYMASFLKPISEV